MGYHEYYQKRYANEDSGYRRTLFTNDDRSDFVNTGPAKRWWERELDAAYSFDDSEFKGRSISSTREVLGHWGSYKKPTGTDVISKLEKVSCEVVRLMNSVRNSDSQDRVLSVSWAKNDGNATNTPDSNSIVLSPDLIVGSDGKAENHDNPEVIDAVGGQALLASTLKRTSEVSSYVAALNDESNNVAEAKYRREVWQATETAIAKQELLAEWPGAAPYIHRHQNMTSSTQAEVEAFIAQNHDTLDGVSAAIAWTLTNPRTPIAMPGDMAAHVNDACTSLIASSKDTRYGAVSDEIEKLKQWYKMPDGTPPGGTPPGGGGGGEPTNPTNPTITDGGIFGRRVPSSHSEVPQDVKQDDNLDDLDKPIMPPGCAIFDNVVVQTPSKGMIGYDYRFGAKKDAVYKYIAKAVAPLTEAIVASLRFRATESKMPVHGLFSGDLDEGSLYKLGERGRRSEQHAVFERGEVQSIPDVAICILLDESGSMACYGDSTVDGKLCDDPSYQRMRRCNGVRAMAVAMVEAFSRLKGLKLSVYGHSSQWMNQVNLYEYLSDKQTDKTNISYVTHRGNNADGWAIMHTMRRFNASYPHVKQKYLFVLSDGQPSAEGRHGDSYYGSAAMKHMANTCDWGLKKYGIRTFGFGMDGAPTKAEGESMYGKGKFVPISNPLTAARVITKFLAQVTTKV